MLLPLDINGRITYTNRIARDQFQIDYLGMVHTSEQLIFDVKSAYYNLLRAQAQADVDQAAVDVAAARLKNTTSQFNAGTVPKFDVTRAEVDVANLNQTLIQGKTSVEQMRGALNRVMVDATVNGRGGGGAVDAEEAASSPQLNPDEHHRTRRASGTRPHRIKEYRASLLTSALHFQADSGIQFECSTTKSFPFSTSVRSMPSSSPDGCARPGVYSELVRPDISIEELKTDESQGIDPLRRAEQRV